MQTLIGCLKYLEEEGPSLHKKVLWKNNSQESGYLLSKSGTLWVFSAAV